MPELPEVETVKRGLQKHLIGHSVIGHEVLRDKSFPNDPELASQFMIGAKITSVGRRAKLLFIGLDTKHSLVIHLKMTGQLVYRSRSGNSFGAGHPTNSLVAKLPDKSTRVVIHLNGADLFFNDQRVFGWIKLVPTDEIPNIEFVKKLGPEPLERDFTVKTLEDQIMRRQRSRIKAVLLDQTVIAGMGNIYTDEALWLTSIHPDRRVESLDAQEINELHYAIISVLTTGIEQGGSTDRNYVDADGEKGNYLEFAQVFRREGQECMRCGEEIIKIRSAGRGTHLCPQCQRNRS